LNKFLTGLRHVLLVVIIAYIGICGFLYLVQDFILFYPVKVDENFRYQFYGDYEELEFKVAENISLNGLLFKTDSSKGLVIFYHGNAAGILHMAEIHTYYNDMGYDFLIYDYRGYGKSEGRNKSEEQMVSDAKVVYDYIKPEYDEKDIVLIGYSLGTGVAARIAAEYSPGYLILMAPYYSLENLAFSKFPFVPRMLFKYPFKTNEQLRLVKARVLIFHGKEDMVIPSSNSKKLYQVFPKKIEMTLIDNCDHNDVIVHDIYLNAIGSILN